MDWPQVIFVALAVGIVFGAYRVATAQVITHAALYLAFVLSLVAGMFYMLQADFVAAVQLLVYAGGIMTVIIFAIMLSELSELKGEVPQNILQRLASPYFGLLPLLVGMLVFAVIMLAVLRVPWPVAPQAAPGDTVTLIGNGLFKTYALPFEVASVLLLGALVGAIVLTRREAGER
ncbi:MAG TPA: NADH-quinone oxidoreductase subunit J [Bacillota bacterium]|nr:NADH-quinone oxidoreductase subunit J [Bacillota bacterium]